MGAMVWSRIGKGERSVTVSGLSGVRGARSLNACPNGAGSTASLQLSIVPGRAV